MAFFRVWLWVMGFLALVATIGDAVQDYQHEYLSFREWLWRAR